MGGKGNKGPSKKTEAKKKEKVVEDKTFGLKNKNKSTKVQAYIKNVHNNVFNEKGGESKKIEDQNKQREEKK